MSGHFGGNPYLWDGGANAPHISRYFLARGWVMPGETVADVACATGYGAHLIGQIAGKVYGLEIDDGCIESANSDWSADNIEFRVFDIDKEELPDVDVLVTIETAEHVQNIDRFLKQITKHTKRCVIFCVPLGGTSYAYTKEEQLTPAGECNDFNNEAYVEDLFYKHGWKLQTFFRYGYSGFFVFFKKSPKRINK
jgi:cyclopropane fatty-acyl-phospholipid synthase-like methyltransferase